MLCLLCLLCSMQTFRGWYQAKREARKKAQQEKDEERRKKGLLTGALRALRCAVHAGLGKLCSAGLCASLGTMLPARHC